MNTSKLLALGLVLFSGACSTTEENVEGVFLDKVKRKSIYYIPDTTGIGVGEFSADGKLLPFSYHSH